AGEDDINILSDLEAGKLNQVSGKIHDLHWIAHIQNKYLTTSTQHSGLQHQLHRFRNCHKVPFHLGISNRYRSSGSDLLLEGKHNAAPASQHIAEADGYI